MSTGKVIVKLSRPLKWEDRVIHTIDLDFDKVTGRVINKCERETYSSGNASSIVRGLSSEYCARMAAMISGVPFEALEKLPSRDYNAVWQTVGAFVSERDPNEFYNQFTGGVSSDFTEPATTPEKDQKEK